MKKQFLVFILTLVFVACAEEVIKKPDDLIPQEKMTQLLLDLAILNSAKNTNSDLLEQYFDSPTTFLFKQYGVDSVQFVKSDLYYASQPLVYEAIYEEVAKRLDLEKERMEEERKIRNDSLASIRRTKIDSIARK